MYALTSSAQKYGSVEEERSTEVTLSSVVSLHCSNVNHNAELDGPLVWASSGHSLCLFVLNTFPEED